MNIVLGPFGGMRPAVEAHLLDLNEAQIAVNAQMDTGALMALPAGSDLKALTKPTVKTLWRFPATVETDHWFEFDGRADVARSPIAQDVWDRVYWSTEGGVFYAPSGTALSGATLPNGGYLLGVPAPDGPAPTVSGSAPPDAARTETRVYFETFVTAYDEEGPRGAISAAATIDTEAAVNVWGLSPIPTWNGNITKRRIYRASYIGGNVSVFQLVDEIPIAQTTYVDTKAQVDLGETWTSELYLPAPQDGFCLRITEGGVALLLRERELHMSEMYLPHAWNPEYIQTLQSKAVALSTFGQAIVVMTNDRPYVAAGIDPSGIQLTRCADSHACLSAAGVVESKEGCLYPSPNGLVAIGPDLQPRVISANVIRQEQWLAYNPSSFIAGLQNGKYHAFFTRADGTTGVLIIDVSGGPVPVTEAEQIPGSPVTAAYRDPSTDTIYVACGGQIRRWNKGGTPRTYRWKSKQFQLPRPMIMGAFVVHGDPGTATLRCYANGVLKATKTVTIGKVGRLPAGFIPRQWEFELETSSKITELRVAPSIEELYQ